MLFACTQSQVRDVFGLRRQTSCGVDFATVNALPTGRALIKCHQCRLRFRHLLFVARDGHNIALQVECHAEALGQPEQILVLWADEGLCHSVIV